MGGNFWCAAVKSVIEGYITRLAMMLLCPEYWKVLFVSVFKGWVGGGWAAAVKHVWFKSDWFVEHFRVVYGWYHSHLFREHLGLDEQWLLRFTITAS